MAAAGQQVYTGFVTPLSPSAAGGMSGPMQARKKKDPDGGLLKDGADFKNLKGVTATSSTAKVGMINSRDGSPKIVKSGTLPEVESALADLYNVAGGIRDERARASKDKSHWSFDAPEARGLDPKERPVLEGLVKGGKFGNRETSAPDDSTVDEVSRETSVFGMVKGSSPREGDTIPSEGGYRKAMGYTSLLDLLAGNMDRTYQLFNPENWMVEAKKKKIHLIDNDYNSLGAKDGRDVSGIWDAHFAQKTGSAGNAGNAFFQGIQVSNMGDLYDSSSMAYQMFGGENSGVFSSGITEASGDLPELHRRLTKKWSGTGTGTQKTMTKEQQELLRRIAAMQARFQQQ